MRIEISYFLLLNIEIYKLKIQWTIFLLISIDCSLIVSLFSLSVYNSFIDKNFTIQQTKFNWGCWQLVDGKQKYLQSFTKSSEV